MFCLAYVLSYYIVSAVFFIAHQRGKTTGFFCKNGFLDITTSIVWAFAAVWLILSLVELAISKQLSLSILIIYYLFFIFLFAFIYALLDWHFSGMLEGVSDNEWTAEVEYLLFSVESITTLGHSRLVSRHILIDVLSALQALLGLFFIVVFVAQAVAGQS